MQSAVQWLSIWRKCTKYHLKKNNKKADYMRTKAYRKKLMADLKSATKNCIESVEKTYATENEKNF